MGKTNKSKCNKGRQQARKSDNMKKVQRAQNKDSLATARTYLQMESILLKAVNILPNLPNPTPIIHSLPPDRVYY